MKWELCEPQLSDFELGHHLVGTFFKIISYYPHDCRKPIPQKHRGFTCQIGPIRMVEAAGELEHSLEMQKVYRHMAPWIPGRLGDRNMGGIHTRWCPSSKSLSWGSHNSHFTMVYGRYNELVFMGFINQHSHHWGAPSCRNMKIFCWIFRCPGALFSDKYIYRYL